MVYGSIMVGKVAEAEREDDGRETTSKERMDLLPFFKPEKPEPVELMGEGMIELPAEEPAPVHREEA